MTLIHHPTRHNPTDTVHLQADLATKILAALNECSVRARSPAELARTRDLAVRLHGALHPLGGAEQ